MSSAARILAVDDNDDNLYTLTQRLRREGYADLSTAADGAEALARLGAESFDLVLLDVMMPVLGGVETLARMKADPATAHLPVIALTAHAMSGDRERAIAAGCDDYDTKPVDLGRLMSKIEALLARARAS